MRLQARGHRVQVLTALPHYPGNTVYSEYLRRENTVEILGGLKVARVGLYVPKTKTFGRRVVSYLTFAANAARHGPSLLEPTDVLMMESPPLFVALAGVPLARRLGARLVANVSDLWPRSAVDLGVLTPGLLLRGAEFLESWMYQRSDAITVQTEGIRIDIQQRFPDKQIILFPNGVDMAEYTARLDRDGIRARRGWKRELTVAGYAGILGHAQALDQLIDAAHLLSPQEGIHIAIFGDGPCREHLERRIANERAECISLHARVPRSRMPHLQAAFDIGLVPLAKGGVFETARPSKMFEIMAAAKPVLLCGRGEAAELIGAADEHAGIAVPPEEPGALAAALRRLATQRRAAAEMGARGKALVGATFDRGRIATDLEQHLLRLVGQRSHPRSHADYSP